MEPKEKSRKSKNVVDNPCGVEHNLSLKCLNENSYDSEKCQSHFDNYNHCKKFWGMVQVYRRRNGIFPHLPPPEERAGIKENYFKTGKIG